MITQLKQAAADITAIGEYLAQRDIPNLTSRALSALTGRPRADILILLGGSIINGIDAAARAYIDGIAERLMIVGGAGHTTQALRDAISALNPQIPTSRRAEADIIADYLELNYSLDRAQFILENKSTNCGENAIFARAVVSELNLERADVILMQDSTMQRRMDATFKRAWQGMGARFINHASYVARVAATGGELEYAGLPIRGMWSIRRFMELIMGEIPRLRDDSNGYGPRGKGFIAHVELPPDLECAFERLSSNFSDLVRAPWRG